ncbi:MAG: hypothetical protein ACTHL1_06025 [Burkholderiaceae bacterium]
MHDAPMMESGRDVPIQKIIGRYAKSTTGCAMPAAIRTTSPKIGR